MKKKEKTTYICTDCGSVSPRWEGKCSSCGSWNTLIENLEAPKRFTESENLPRTELPLLSEVDLDSCVRSATGIPDLDTLLGGGLVPGSFILVGGEPGVGKSTLLLEVARKFPGKIYYFSGEESPAQVRMRAERLSLKSDRLYISRETELDLVCARIRAERPDLAVIDSVQTLYRSGQTSLSGSPAILKEAAIRLLDVCKETKVPLVVTGHITKDGSIAGPRMMEHMVDVVLYFESDRLNHFRILRSVKNRFGPTGDVAIFEMYPGGLREAGSRMLMGNAEQRVGSGRVYTAMVEGSRALGVEVQALVSRSYSSQLRRMAEGLDGRRLVLMAAVLEKYLKLTLAECDVFANLAGGLTADEPALDLALCVAILSSFRESAVKMDAAFIGEVGLSGEVRPVSCAGNRVKELANLGYRNFYLPEGNCREIDEKGVILNPLRHIVELTGKYGGIFERSHPPS